MFGLGAVLVEILTGKPSYVGDDPTQVFRMASRGKLDGCYGWLDACGPEKELTEIARMALSPERDDRFGDAGDLSGRFTGYLEGVQERLRQTELARVEAQARSEEEQQRKKALPDTRQHDADSSPSTKRNYSDLVFGLKSNGIILPRLDHKHRSQGGTARGHGWQIV